MGGPGSSTLLAKIEPSGFFVSLASHIFIFLNKHMLTSEATIISNYIKNGLAEPQMIVLADMIHDLEGMVSPQVRPKMNDKKPSKFQFYFSGVLEAFSMLKKWKKKIVSLDFGDNPIYPISNPDGQDREV